MQTLAQYNATLDDQRAEKADHHLAQCIILYEQCLNNNIKISDHRVPIVEQCYTHLQSGTARLYNITCNRCHTQLIEYRFKKRIHGLIEWRELACPGCGWFGEVQKK